jgi:hypothetical protein
MSLITLPPDVVFYGIISTLPMPSLTAIRSVTIGFRDLLNDAARISRVDLTFANKTFHVTPGSFVNLARYFQKQRVINRNPGLFVQIGPAIDATVLVGANPDEVKDLIRYGGERVADLTVKLVVFDYESKQIKANGPKGLGAALELAIRTGDEEMVESIFLHPNVKNIQLDDFGIIDCLNDALTAKNREAVKKIVLLPAAKNIKSIARTESLGHFLCRAAQTNDIVIVNSILSLPKSIVIPTRFIVEALITAVENDNVEIVERLFLLPSAEKIDPSALDSAIRKAKGANKSAIIDVIVNATSPDKLCKLQSVLELQSSLNNG